MVKKMENEKTRNSPLPLYPSQPLPRGEKRGGNETRIENSRLE